ncbi:hypothetical protein DY000_02048308 [Brassica cretica]|uniref:Uncharacterized protein n=1 Tax=Brassica cretica TaxID=69181 RepID=A0ABQ7F3P3_BRACR|nr:hypothetical protein DY000_02048308 [Brassica cretica]
MRVRLLECLILKSNITNLEIAERSWCKDQPLAKVAARELEKKKTRPDRVRLPQDTSVTRRKTVPDSSRPVPACDPIRSQLASVYNYRFI